MTPRPRPPGTDEDSSGPMKMTPNVNGLPLLTDNDLTDSYTCTMNNERWFGSPRAKPSTKVNNRRFSGEKCIAASLERSAEIVTEQFTSHNEHILVLWKSRNNL
jgi:hypothetical protein